MSTYRERREAKADRLRGWADKRESESARTLDEIHDRYSGDHAFNFQPGHIPERARVIARQDRAFASLDKARDMTRRANGIDRQLRESIYDDDPDAVEQLEARIAALEAERDRIKRYNVSCRKGARDVSILDDRQRGQLANVARVAAYQLGKRGEFPSYALSGLSGNIKRNRDRLVVVKRRQERQEASEACGVLVERHGNGYCTVTFAEKPAREVIVALKAGGFRWGKGSWFGPTATLPEGVA